MPLVWAEPILYLWQIFGEFDISSLARAIGNDPETGGE